MTFIEPDEFIIAVDYRGFFHAGLAVPEIAQLHEAGVRTMLQHPIWRNIETSFGHYDWATTDEMADLAQRGGVKLLLQLGEIAPAFFPDDWYLRDYTGVIHRNLYDEGAARAGGELNDYSAVSYWHPEAWAHFMAYLTACCERYNSANVQCMYGGSVHGGEHLFPSLRASFYDPAALASFRAITGQAEPTHEIQGLTRDWLLATVGQRMIELQRLFVDATGEYWTHFHRHFYMWPWTGDNLVEDIYRLLHADTDAPHMGTYSTAYRPSCANEGEMGARDARNFGIQMFVGSEGPQGLPANTATAIAQGFRGFITGVLLTYIGNTRVEPWMFANIAASLAQWRAAQP